MDIDAQPLRPLRALVLDPCNDLRPCICHPQGLIITGAWSGPCPTAKRRCSDIPALPFCHSTTKSIKSTGYNNLEDCQTMGDHLKRKRLLLGLRQIDVAGILGIGPWTLANWETGKAEPLVRYYPAIADFLGYCPYERAESLGERVALHRRYRGLSQRDLAKKIGVDPASIARWEAGERIPGERKRQKLWQSFDRKC